MRKSSSTDIHINPDNKFDNQSCHPAEIIEE